MSSFFGISLRLVIVLRDRFEVKLAIGGFLAFFLYDLLYIWNMDVLIKIVD